MGTFGLDRRRRRGEGGTFVCFEMGWDGKIISSCNISLLYTSMTPCHRYGMVVEGCWRG